MPSPSVLGFPRVDGHVHSLVPGDGIVVSQELVSPEPPRRKEVILTLDSSSPGLR